MNSILLAPTVEVEIKGKPVTALQASRSTVTLAQTVILAHNTNVRNVSITQFQIWSQEGEWLPSPWVPAQRPRDHNAEDDQLEHKYRFLNGSG